MSDTYQNIADTPKSNSNAPVYVNKGSAVTQNLIFSAALLAASCFGLYKLADMLRTNPAFVDSSAPNGYSLYQFSYGIIGAFIKNFKIDDALASLLPSYNFDKFCSISGGLLLASIIGIVTVLVLTVIYNIYNLSYLAVLNKVKKSEVMTLSDDSVERKTQVSKVVNKIYAAVTCVSLLLSLCSVVPLSLISGAALAQKTAGDSATAESVAARAKIAVIIGFVIFFIAAVRGITKKWDRIKENGSLVCAENLGSYIHGLIVVSIPFLTVIAIAALIVILLLHFLFAGARLQSDRY